MVRYEQLYQNKKLEIEHSLFDGADAAEIATPPIPKLELWSNIGKLSHEHDLVGTYLPVRPLDEFSIMLKSTCNTSYTEPGDKAKSAKKADAVFAGVITEVKDKFTGAGKPCGSMTIEDFSGTDEIAFFDEERGKWKGMMVASSTVYFTGKCPQ